MTDPISDIAADLRRLVRWLGPNQAREIAKAVIEAGYRRVEPAELLNHK